MAVPKKSQPVAKPPPGWRVVVVEGHVLDDPDDIRGSGADDLTKVRGLPVLPRFWLGAFPEGDPWRIVLQFVVQEGDVSLPLVQSSGEDVTAALDQLRKAWPMQAWTRFAFAEAVRIAVDRELDAEAETEVMRRYFPDGKVDSVSWQQAHEWVGRLQAPQRRAVIDASLQVPLARRRNRITDEHLRQVAMIYSNADAAGLNPTEAVSVHPSWGPVGHSTAARWVAMARELAKRDPSVSMPPVTRGRRRAQP